ncbi:MAG: hypothetical protein KDC46_02740 [Thermoleophilia bacterium]|nr:hypothetical protein [Thermoleophilia bacterium]
MVAVFVVAVVMALLAGMLVASNSNVSLADARSAGSKSGAQAGSVDGAQAGFDAGDAAGEKAGLKDGRAKTYQSSFKAAYRTAYRRNYKKALDDEKARLAEEQRRRDPNGDGSGCPLYWGRPYGNPSGACIPPAHGPTSGAATVAQCEAEYGPGWTPAGQTGACAPPY